MNIHESAMPLLRGLATATATAIVLGTLLASPSWAADKDLATSKKKVSPKPAVSVQLRPELKIQDAKDDPDQKKDVNKEVPGGGPQPDIPGFTRDVKISAPGSKASDPSQAIQDAATIRDGTSNTQLISEEGDKGSQRPKFDNGFDEKPKIDEAAVPTGNPLNTLTGNGSVDGPLGEAAKSSGALPARGFDRGSISDGGGITNPSSDFKDGELKVKGKGQLDKEFGLDDKKVTGLVMGGKRFEEIEAISRGEDPGAGKPAGVGNETKPVKEDKLICHNDPCTHSATVHPDGSVDVRKPDGTRETIQPDGSSVTVDKDGKVIDQQDAAGTPDPDKENVIFSKEELLRQKLDDKNFQIKQAAKAGGDVNPDRGETTTGGVSRSGAVPSQQETGRALFGQPVDQGLSQGGAPTGPNFNGDLGAIDPGPDATVNTGPGREQDRVGETLGRVDASGSLDNPLASDDEDSDDKDKDKDDSDSAQ